MKNNAAVMEKEHGKTFGEFRIKVDFMDNDKAVIVTAEIPGMNQKDIDIELSSDTLTIKGEKRVEKEEFEKGHYHSERSFGFFQRVLALPCQVDKDKVEATYKNGILKIVMEKDKESEKDVKKITLKSGSH